MKISKKDIKSKIKINIDLRKLKGSVKICTTCGRDVETCDDRFDMYGQDIGDKKWKPMGKNIKRVWGSGFKVSKELFKKDKEIISWRLSFLLKAKKRIDKLWEKALTRGG